MARWLPPWLPRRVDDSDVAEEVRAHLRIEIRQRIESGESAEEARRAATRAFGSVLKTHEDVREAWGWPPIERFIADLQFGLRMLRKTPTWTVVMSFTLALGIGLSTAVFSVAYGVLWQRLPYHDPEQLVAIWPTATTDRNARFYASAALWMHWRDHATLLGDVALTRPIANFNLTGDATPERLQGARMTFNVPRVLGIPPLLGRTFTEEEQRSDARVAILSYGLWTRRFGRDADIIGRKIQLNGEPFEVIGIMPAEYRYPSANFELWTPLYIPPMKFDSMG